MVSNLSVLAPAFALVVGAVASWLFVRLRARRERAALEDDMRAKVEERYEAYLDLEERIRRAMKGFDQREALLRRRIANQSESIEALREALDRHQSFDSVTAAVLLAPDHAKDTDFLGMPVLDEASEASEESSGDALSEMDEWERQAEGSVMRNTAELARQSAELLAITQHVQRMEPLVQTLGGREEQLASWRRKYTELERALAHQTDVLQSCLQDLAPVASQVGQSEEELRGLRAQYEDRIRAEEHELEQATARIAELESALENLSGELQSAREELLLVGAERDSLDVRLGTEIEKIAELSTVAPELEAQSMRLAELSANLESSRESTATLERRLSERTRAFERQCAELERRVVEADEARTQLERELEQAGERLHEVDRVLVEEKQRARGSVDQIAQELSAQRERHARLEREREEALGRVQYQSEALAAKERLLAERERQVAELSGEVEDLRASLGHATQSLEGEKSRIGTLMRELDDVQQRFTSRDSTLSEAQNVLHALRPMIQSLEEKLQGS